MDDEKKHTPGPWHITIEQRPDGRTDIPLALEVRATLGRTQPLVVGGIDERDNANARLIAAAPELLEALEAVVSTLATYAPDAPERKAARAALKKARGE